MSFEVPIADQEAVLLQADAVAMQGIKVGAGAPFGAILRVYYPAKNTYLFYDFATAHNTVRRDSFTGAHAEHNAMELAIQTGLYEFLGAHPNSLVVLFSSGESCSNCRTKEEILARDLIGKGLIQSKQFIVYYGATFEDAEKLAGFCERDYLNDFAAPQSKRHIPVHYIPLSTSPYDTGCYAAIIILRQDCLAKIMVTDAVPYILHNRATMAIQSAGDLRKTTQIERPWKLDKSSLLLHGSFKHRTIIGPLTYATALFADIGGFIVTFSDNASPDHENKMFHDSQHIDNINLFNFASGPHSHSDAVLTINVPTVRDKLTAQRYWGELIRQGKIPANFCFRPRQSK